MVITTCGTEEEARRLAESIVAGRLGACVQIDSIDSTYRWEGSINREPEFRLVVKTTQARYAELEKHIAANHSYTVPQIVCVPFVAGGEAYLRWIEEETSAE